MLRPRRRPPSPLCRATASTDTCCAGNDGSQKELVTAWALFISVMLLIIAFLASYFLKERKIEAVHETVISIFAGPFSSDRCLTERDIFADIARSLPQA